MMTTARGAAVFYLRVYWRYGNRGLANSTKPPAMAFNPRCTCGIIGVGICVIDVLAGLVDAALWPPTAT